MKKRKIKKLKYDNIVLSSLVALLIVLIIITGVLVISLIKNTLVGTTANGIKILDTMDKHGYDLTENHTNYFKSLYYDLKELLEKKEINDEEYAVLVAKLFVTDFYDLNSKLNKTDVGGEQFVYFAYRESFKNYASDSTGIYYYVENNIYGDRKQKLPIIEKVEEINTEIFEYSYEKLLDSNAYKIDLFITYKENLGYPEHVSVILVHVGDKIEVVEMN
jgi:hypothetical protein